MPGDPREAIGRTLCGDVLEIGPGSAPFPIAPGARKVVVDKPVPGGRDSNWPELVGTPRGPDSDFDLDLDLDGLAPFGDASFDVVIASHVIEHLANPLSALQEFHRVLRPTGRLVLVVPDRTRTFDQERPPTTPLHVLSEYRDGIQTVSDEHILEFCQAIYRQPPAHPTTVREWHNPESLTPAMYDLHRRRSIHVHCWDPQEFALTLAIGMAAGTAAWKLVRQYTSDDCEPPGIEFGLVLTRGEETGPDPAERFLADWVSAVIENPVGVPRAASLTHNVLLFEPSPSDAARWVRSIVGALVRALEVAQAREVRSADVLRGAESELAGCRNEPQAIRTRRPHRLAAQLDRPVRALRRGGVFLGECRDAVTGRLRRA